MRDYDQQAIFLFDKKGKYITKLDKRGEGPEEYTHLDKFLVDDNEEYIEILDFSIATQQSKSSIQKAFHSPPNKLWTEKSKSHIHTAIVLDFLVD